MKNIIGRTYIDITESDAEDFLYDEEHTVAWCFPVFDKNKKKIGYVDIIMGRSVKDPREETKNLQCEYWDSDRSELLFSKEEEG